jgi:hypothetical protein
MSTTPEPTLAERLAATASGNWNLEAAVWLLTEHGHWLPELHRRGLIDTGTEYPGYAEIHWRRSATTRGLVGTDSELQVLDVARALAIRGSAFLDNLTSLDEANKRLMLHAVAWAAGGQDWAKTLGLLGAELPTDATEIRIQKSQETRFRVRYRTDDRNRSRSFVHHSAAAEFAMQLRANRREA